MASPWSGLCAEHPGEKGTLGRCPTRTVRCCVAEGLSYMIWGLGRGYVSEKNLALDYVQMRDSAHPGPAACHPSAWVWEDGGADPIPSPSLSPGRRVPSRSCGAVLTVKASSGGRPEDSLVLHRPAPLPLVIPQPLINRLVGQKLWFLFDGVCVQGAEQVSRALI